MPDEVYRTLLLAKIAANAWDGTTPMAYAIWDAIFEGQDDAPVIFIEDSGRMSMIIGIAVRPMNALMQQLVLRQYIPLKPAGVRIDFFAIAPGPIFAWNCESEALAGWGSGWWAKKIAPFAV